MALQGRGDASDALSASEAAEQTLQRLVEQYEAAGGRFVDVLSKSTGLIYSCAGPTSLLLLSSGFDLELDEVAKGIVRTEFARACSHVGERGFDATPAVTSGMTEKFFSPRAKQRDHYLDSVSWVLGFMLQIRLAARNDRLDLEREDLQRAEEMTKRTLEIVCEGACPGGGWGFATRCNEPDLYYSYVVSEALADLGDYVLGELPGIAEDSELQAFLGADLIKQVADVRARTARWLVESYLAQLGECEIDPYGENPSPPHILLYYTYFVIDMLIACRAASALPDREKEIFAAIESGIYRTRIDFRNAQEDEDWFGHPNASSLTLRWSGYESPRNVPRLRGAPLYEPGLVPLSLRCNALYAYYVAKGGDTKMDALLGTLLENRDEKTGLWDSDGFTLLVTERAVEALVDYHDYETRFKGARTEGPAPAATGVDGQIQRVARDAVRAFLDSQEGAQCLRNAVRASGAAQGPARRDDNQVLEDMTSGLALIEQLAFGRPLGDVDRGDVRQLARQLGESLLSCLLISSDLLGEEELQRCEGRLKESYRGLATWFGGWIGGTSSVKLEDMMTWLGEQSAIQGGGGR